MDSFKLQPGRRLASRYEIVERLGGGSEGEVYKIIERETGLTRAAKLFFPGRSDLPKRFVRYARKLEKLRDCDIVVKYLHAERVSLGGEQIRCLISEYVGGELLEDMMDSFPGKKFPSFEALSLIYSLTRGIDEIHARREFHGDLHTGNIFVERQGVHFKLRTFDFHDWGRSKSIERKSDVISVTRILYDLVGGKRVYAKQSEFVKSICLGLRSDLVLERFPTIFHLKAHLENFEWE